MDRTDPWTWSVPDHYLCHSAQESPSLKEKPIPRLHRTLMLSLCSCLLLLNLRLVLIKRARFTDPLVREKQVCSFEVSLPTGPTKDCLVF